MTRSEFHRLMLDAQDAPDFDVYLAECGGSLPAEYYTGDYDGECAIHAMRMIWNLRENLTFSAIRKISGMSQSDFSNHYGIPKRTVENWDSGTNTPPTYLLNLLAADVISEIINNEFTA